MRSITLSALMWLMMTASAVYAADAAPPASHPKHHKPAAKSTTTKKSAAAHKKPDQMSEAKRRDLERRIQALEQKSEMQYHETDSPNGAPGAH